MGHTRFHVNPNKDFHDMSHDKLRNASWVKQQQ